MLLDARAISENDRIETDLCIVGAGPAGISIAREFIGKGLRVCVLESGGATPSAEDQKLNEGRSVGYWYYPLASTRTRAFGGTSTHWDHNIGEDGRPYRWYTRPLDAIDFESRPGIPHSGWPFPRDALMPFYERAQEVCRLGPFDYDGAAWDDSATPERLPLSDDAVVTNVFQYGEHTFAEYLAELSGAPNVTAVLHASACELLLDEDQRTIRGVVAKSAPTSSFRVAARAYVLAAGAMENARLLLLSTATHTAGIGNANDLVGRFFMERLSIRSGTILPENAELNRRLPLYTIHLKRGTRIQATLGLDQERMRREGLLNAALFVVPTYKAFTSEGVRSLVALYRAARRRPWPGGLVGHTRNILRDLDQVALTVYRQTVGGGGQNSDVCILRIHAEQAPNRESRVTLDSRRDALGLPAPSLDWRVGDLDRESIRRTQEILDRELRQANLGRIDRPLGDEDPPALFRGAFHHMGTTRMHRDPAQGVVDADSLVHGTANLFVAGSSVFPTAGCANPTLTVVALALRLSDHLASVLGRD
jgi:choline dehydrogenase-like flavoprotein